MHPLKIAATLSQLAYRHRDETEAMWSHRVDFELGILGMTLLCSFDRIDTQGFICRRGRDLIVVFRGTDPERGTDVETDLHAWPRRDRMGLVHAGFSIALDHVWDQIASKIESHHSLGGKLYFFGHSMGGALAVIAASRCLRSHGIGGVVTFGAPPAVGRFVASVLETMLNGDCVRVQRADAVTLVLRLLYRSPGLRFYITSGGRLIDRAGWYVALHDRLGIIWRSIKQRLSALVRCRFAEVLSAPVLVSNHSMDGYTDALAEL